MSDDGESSCSVRVAAHHLDPLAATEMWSHCYRIFSNRRRPRMVTALKWSPASTGCRPRMVTALKWSPPSNGRRPRMVTAFKWSPPLNGHRPQMVASSNSRHPRMVAALKWLPALNSSSKIGRSEQKTNATLE